MRVLRGWACRRLRRSPAARGLVSAAAGPALRVLGIESTCDDSAAAVVTGDGQVLSDVNWHQFKVHEEFGGIVPGLATENHLKNVPLVVREALERASMRIDDVDAIAVARGPGLPGGLTVGMAAAKTLAAVHNKPLVGVHHMEAHALMARMTSTPALLFPYLCLLISGGHTMTLVAHDVSNYTLLGSTRDDSVGEAFDKVARELAIPWIDAQVGGGPGPALEALAAEGDAARFPLPVPMDKSTSATSLDFSFSGIKTRIRRMREQGDFDPTVRKDQADVAAAFQHTATTHLYKKAARALHHAQTNLGADVTCIVASGGVASNQTVRRRLSELAAKNRLRLVCPPPRLCTDNGVMIAWAGIERLRRGLVDPYDINPIQRWPLDQLKDTPRSKGSS
ncbi:Mitochondrial tRNAs modification protein [Coemansia sp. RSA 552]|nr:Mitochondrial tRNAs modification protein [Coemansia sp. RSA 552]